MQAKQAPLTIAHVTGERGYSGGEVQVFLLMRELGRLGHRNLLVCPPGSRSEQEARRRGIDTYPVPMRVALSPLAIARARRALRRGRPDLVHLHTGRANWVGGIAAWSLSLPAITTRRMDRPVRRGPRTRWLYTRGVRHAVAISPAVRARLLAAGVPAERTRVIPSAVDPEAMRARRSRAEVRRELGADDGACCLLVLAHLSRRKGVDVLLEALARLANPPPLWIAGDGEERAALEAHGRRLGLGSVHFLGRREDRACLLQACDVFVMPSRNEGLGVAALEAMACGRPVVASRVGGLADLVDKTTGRLVPVEDPAALAAALDALRADPALRQRLGAAGPARVREGHLPEQMAAAYAALYRDVLGGRALVSAPRVGLVGARRARQGLGPYVARDLAAGGAQVPCFLGVRPETLDETRDALRAIAGVDAVAYLDLGAMLANERLDALAILSPAETHAAYLVAAARAGLHVLCEKPFVWGGPSLVERTRDLLAQFAARDLQVWENCQWPWTLAGFEALHPGALARPPRRFEMELEPRTRGLQSLADALPHALSLLQALVPGGGARVEAPRFSSHEPGADALSIGFRYRTDLHGCDVQVHLRCRERPPRHAAYALDGRRATRLVSPSDYSLSFTDSQRSVPIEDPLTGLVKDFVAALSGAPGVVPPPARHIQERMQHLVALATAYAPEEIR